MEGKKTFKFRERQERQVVDMNKIIAFRNLCTETTVNETAGVLKFLSFGLVFNWRQL